MLSEQAPTTARNVTAECHRFTSELSEVVDGGDCLNPTAIEHFGSCLRCQAELVQYKKLLRALSNLRGHTVTPDDYLFFDIMRALDRAGEGWRRHFGALSERPGFLRGTGAIAATAGAAACTAGAIVLANRLTSRHRLVG